MKTEPPSPLGNSNFQNVPFPPLLQPLLGQDRIVVGLVKSLNQGLWLHIWIHFMPLNQ